MKLKSKKISLLLPVVALLFASCSRQDSRIIGSIDGTTYTVSSFLSLFLSPEALAEHRKDIADKDIAAGFEQYASFVVFSGEADKSGFFKKHPDIQADFDKKLKSITEGAYQKYVIDHFLKPKMDAVKIASGDLDNYKKRVQVRHILLSKDGSMKDPAKGKAKEEEILQKLKSGSSFEDLAKAYSEDPGTKDAGGLLSQWIYKNDSSLVPEFRDAAMSATKIHQVIPDVQTPFGLHIIYVENIQERSTNEIQKNDPQIYNQVLSSKKNEIAQNFVNDLSKEFNVDKNPNLDLLDYFHHYTKDKGNETLFTINKTRKYTGQEFIETVLQGDVSQIKSVPSNDAMESFVKNYGVTPVLLQMYAENKGAKEDPAIQKVISTQEMALKANLYIGDMLSAKGLKADKIPDKKDIVISNKEIEDFYNKNKSLFSDNKGNTKSLKDATKDIKDFIAMDKVQQAKQKHAQDINNFITKESQRLYPEYKIVLNEKFINETPSKKAT